MLHKFGSLFFAWLGFIFTWLGFIFSCVILAVVIYHMGGGIL